MFTGKRDTMQRNVAPVPVPVDSSVAIKITIGASMFQEKALMARSDVWHKVKILRGALYHKEVVLKAVLSAVEPAEIIPVKYQINGDDTFFLARNCAAALEKLCRSSLIIKTADGEPLILLLTLAFASIQDLRISIQPTLLAALTKRYDPRNKMLDLENFHNESELAKSVYCPLSHLRTFNHVLKLAKNAIATFEYLSLQNNELVSLDAVEIGNLSAVKYLDLRHNNLMNMNVLTPLSSLPITKLWLDSNPLCENYSAPEQYIQSAKKYCPKLMELDGVYIGASGMPLTYSNYFYTENREELVRQFATHFFNLYDQPDRMCMKGLYHKNALYSLSCNIPSSTAHKRALVQFTANRNLLKVTDPNKRNVHLFYGQDNILVGLKRLPRSYHEKNSFIYDLIYDNGKHLVITIQGLFKNLANKEVLSFNRTFVLLTGECNEYNILNDQYNVGDAPEGITSDCVHVKTTYDEIKSTCFSSKEKDDLVAKLQNITTMNTEWCESYLTEANWNMRKAITSFVKDYKSMAIPKDAF